jgi:hypothetical protein
MLQCGIRGRAADPEAGCDMRIAQARQTSTAALPGAPEVVRNVKMFASASTNTPTGAAAIGTKCTRIVAWRATKGDGGRAAALPRDGSVHAGLGFFTRIWKAGNLP